MTKISKISVTNLKSIQHQEIEMNGASIIVTAGNGKGKSTLTKSFFDRIRGEKNDSILRTNEVNGSQVIEFNDGNIIEWKVTAKTETFTLITKEGLKVNSIKQIKDFYFKNEDFDINEFLELGPQKQAKKLQKLIGLDLSEIEKRYSETYEKRKEANYNFDALTKNKIEKPLEVEKPEIESIKKELAESKLDNQKRSSIANADYQKKQNEVNEFNNIQDQLTIQLEIQNSRLIDVEKYLKHYSFESYFDFEKAKLFIESLEKPLEFKEYPEFQDPELINIQEIESKLEVANEQLRKFDLYEYQLKQYNDWVENGKKARELKDSLEIELKAIEKEKRDLIASAEMPAGFEFCDSELLYCGFPLNKNSQSTSNLYIAGLKLATMNLGLLKTVHFEASALDKENLLKVYEYAKSKDLQLFVEKPDFDGGEIRYEIIENL